MCHWLDLVCLRHLLCSFALGLILRLGKGEFSSSPIHKFSMRDPTRSDPHFQNHLTHLCRHESPQGVARREEHAPRSALLAPPSFSSLSFILQHIDAELGTLRRHHLCGSTAARRLLRSKRCHCSTSVRSLTQDDLWTIHLFNRNETRR